MSLFNHFKNLTLTSDQQQALEKIDAFLENDEQVFILKGYAGSGKTTLIKGLVDYLIAVKRNFKVLAPTGRAAKVLRDKTSHGITIHKGIYNFDKLETYKDDSEEVAEMSFRYFFPITVEIHTHRIVIVDEASMVSDVKTEHELFRFGSGRLLSDLLTYMQLHLAGNKIIFVGDPAQLPPYSDAESRALKEDYFVSSGISASSYEMKIVIRQASGSLILKNATNIRDLLSTKQRHEFRIECDNKECVEITSTEAPSKYVADFPLPEVGNGVIISFSNEQCFAYNQLIRERLFPENKTITEGDLLLINNNNYHTYGVELYNGDMAKVVFVSPETTLQSAPVIIKKGSSNVRKIITLTFRDIVIRIPHYDHDIQCKIIDSLLNSRERDLTVYEMKALYVNFIIRFDEEQKTRSSRGLEVFKRGSREFKEQLKSDSYFNALRVKYGYAITCHKAQGGEWEKAYVNFYGRIGLNDDCLRWSYTAITRASKILYTINAPAITSFDKLKFSPVGKIGTIPVNAIQYSNVPSTPFHSKHSHPAKRLKYFEVIEKTKDSPYLLEYLESRDYQEMYFFKIDDKQIRIDAIHNAGGYFHDFKAFANNQEVMELTELLMVPYSDKHVIEYQPSTSFLQKLWNKVQKTVNELDICITNVEEQVEKYFVNYFFKTSGKVSYIQFFFKQNGQFTTALPKSDLGDEDFLLKEIIHKLSENDD